MATVTSPLMSMGARGQIGKSLVFSAWKGTKTVRSYVIPANPNSAAQQVTRTTFQWVHDAYKNMSADVQAAWLLKAAQQKITGPNAWMSVNLPLLKASTDASQIQFICEVNGGPSFAPPTSALTTGQCVLTFVPPALPAGWSITELIGVCLKSVNPHGEDEAMDVRFATKTATPWTATFTGLTAATQYVVGGSFKYARSASVNAYSVSQAIMITAT